VSLTDIQRLKLRDAMLMGGFGQNDFRHLMTQKMGISPQELFLVGPTASVAYSLVSWCDSQGRVDDLTRAVGEQCAGNPAVRIVIATLRNELGFQPLAPPNAVGNCPATSPSTATAASPQRVNSWPADILVRQFLINRYPDRDRLARLVEDRFGDEYDRLVTRTHEEEVKKYLDYVYKNRGFRLRPLLAVLIAEHPDSPELVDLYRELDAAG